MNFKKFSFVIIMVCGLLMACLLNACTYLPANASYNMLEEKQSVPDIYYLYNDDVYVWVDPDTKVEYLVYSHKGGYAGMGGMVPRYNADGTLRIHQEEE